MQIYQCRQHRQHYLHRQHRQHYQHRHHHQQYNIYWQLWLLRWTHYSKSVSYLRKYGLYLGDVDGLAGGSIDFAVGAKTANMAKKHTIFGQLRDRVGDHRMHYPMRITINQ